PIRPLFPSIQISAPTPFTAVNCCEYGTPTVQSGRSLVVICNSVEAHSYCVTLNASTAASTTEPSPRSPTSNFILTCAVGVTNSDTKKPCSIQPPLASCDGPTVSTTVQLVPLLLEIEIVITSEFGAAPKLFEYQRA